MSPLPIRIRLTLWYFAMLASAAALLSVASFLMLQQSLEKIEYHDLQERADDVRKVLSHETPGKSVSQINEDLSALYELKDDGKFLQVRDQQGNWLFRSQRMTALSPELASPETLPKAGLIVDFRKGSHSVRTLAYPIETRGQLYAVQTGLSLDKSSALLKSFRLILLLLTPAVILLATVGGHLMSRRALNPVAVLAAEARRINDRNLDIRLPVPLAKDELSDLARTLNQMLERIDSAFSSVRTFTGNASHELRTPISLLRAEIEVALFRPREGEEYRAILTRLHDESLRMTNLVENLLSLARADGGAEAMMTAPIPVDALLRQVEQTWQSTMNQAMLDFRVDIPEGDLFLMADQRAIQRLLSILLENASRFTSAGGSVELSAVTKGRSIVLSVRDTGIGIAPEHHSRIFERFYRVPPSSTISSGSGLGLALAKWIAERHASQLVVESVPGLGSEFSFSLDRVDSAFEAISISEGPGETRVAT